MNDARQRLCRRLDYRFNDERLLALALRHRSCGAPDNERLEFFGDGLLNFLIGEALFLRCVKAAEGELSRLRAGIVREETLARVARGLDLGDVIELGIGEQRSGGFRRDSILADALEALLGAIYFDGGFDAVRAVCARLFEAELTLLLQTPVVKDPKTRLQEALQSLGRELPEYQLLSEEGPPHLRRFRVRCRLPDGPEVTEGEGGSRKIAQQRAAERMLAAASLESAPRMPRPPAVAAPDQETGDA